jgi:hypothetical protein
MDATETVRPKTVASRLLLTVEKADTARTTTVTVLTPPAVQTGEPPMNISTSETSVDATVRFS